MATSGMSYAVHYDLSDAILQDFSRMRIETVPEPPVLYVAMATWIPKCNMYHHKYVVRVWLYLFGWFYALRYGSGIWLRFWINCLFTSAVKSAVYVCFYIFVFLFGLVQTLNI